MKRALGSQLALLTALGIGSVLHPTVVQAAQFDQTEVADPSRFVVMASPIGTTGNYKLLIFEQLNNRRQCWGEVGSNPTTIDPLFMQFDFTGICGRSTDSNAYSVRVAGQELGGRYNLRLVRQQNDLVLIGFSLVDKDVQFFEIGRTNGLADGYLKIQLDPGWRLTRRTFQGKPVGHLYLTNDRSLTDIANTAKPLLPAPTQRPTVSPPSPPPIAPSPPSQTLTPVPSPTPVAPQQPIEYTAPSSFPPPTQPAPTTPTTPDPGTPGNYVVPIMPQSSPSVPPAAAPKSLSSGWNAGARGTVIVPVMPIGNGTFIPSNGVVPRPVLPNEVVPDRPVATPVTPSVTTGTGYRVIVNAATVDQQNQVRRLVPGAFRTTVNGQAVMQAGVFRDRAIANSLQQQLATQNLMASVLPTAIVPTAQPPLGNRPPSVPPGSFAGGFNLPQPSTSALTTPLSLWSTYYYTHQATPVVSASPGAYPLLDRFGNDLGITLSHRDWCAAALQGSVQIMNGQQVLNTYNFAGRGDTPQVDCSPFYPTLRTLEATNRVRFKPARSLYGEGAGLNSLVPYRSIAVDPTRIPLGSVVFIPEARGIVVTLPSGQPMVHDGYFYAADVGAAVKNNQIDVFIGTAERNPFRFVRSTSTATFTAYVVNDPQIQATFAAQHRPGTVAVR
ncbi:MAG: DUF3747 domain-containing protein [Leptolyngbyaceae cyanobacterium bins.349]|nr:DUF3747 domain-containing protein [Leptolyngbyaceae cyanobacterium bins.349]